MALPKHINSKESGKFNSDNSIMVREKMEADSFDSIKTTVTTSASEVNLPDSAKNGIILIQINSNKTIWLGQDNSISVAGDNAFPLIANEYLHVNIKKGSTLYAIASENLDMYAGGEINV